MCPALSKTPHPILLAAGNSGRFHGAKLLATLDGQSLLRRAIVALQSACIPDVRVVVGARAAQIGGEAADCGAIIINNLHWQGGLAASLRAGIQSLPADAPAALIALADQIALTAADYRRLVAAWCRAPQSIVAARYAGVVGVPVIWPAAYFGALRALGGDSGARHLLGRLKDSVVAVDLPNAGVDIDTRGDLSRYREKTGPT